MHIHDVWRLRSLSKQFKSECESWECVEVNLGRAGCSREYSDANQLSPVFSLYKDSIRSVSLPSFGQTAILKVLSPCSRLEILDLQYSKELSDHDLAYVAQRFKKLKSLSLYSCSGVTCKGLQNLRSTAPTLQVLNLWGAMSAAPFNGAVGCLTRLRVLSVSELRLNDADIEEISRCKELISLSMDSLRRPLTSDDFRPIVKKCTKIRYLSLSRSEIGDITLEEMLQYMIDLECLHVEACSLLSAKGITALATSASNLRYLNMSFCSQVPSNIVHEISRIRPTLELWK